LKDREKSVDLPEPTDERKTGSGRKEAPAAAGQKPGVYVHFPFCRRRCLYCDFVTFSLEDLPRDYFESLSREARLRHSRYADVFRGPDSLYLGGGSPSLIAIPRLKAALGELRALLGAEQDCETTLEVNPEDVTDALAEGWRAAGINRISLGVQSMRAEILQNVKRGGDPATARRSLRLLRGAGFHNISCDLILGLPGETPRTWRRSLEDTLALNPEHLSVYMLEVHEHGRLAATEWTGSLALPPEDELADLYLETRQILESRGLYQYEISNFARPDRRSRHNMKYWNMAPVLGLGAGAHSFDGRFRWWNDADPGTYQRAVEKGHDPASARDDGSVSRRMEEFVFLGFRVTAGINLGDFKQRFGVEFPLAWRRRLKKFVERGLVLLHNDTLCLSPEGMLLSNEIFQTIIMDEPFPG
jgi:oxygen-independent coproporphyrinogen-3 oxidase